MKKLLLICFLIFCTSCFAAGRDYLVTRVVDGDTIVLDTGEKVRLIGVDTPETKHPKKPVEYFGKEASSFTKGMCEGKRVRLEYDQTRRDRYGRVLAYVYLQDGTFVNAEIIKQGYGHAYTRFPFKYLEQFRGYERYARDKQRGLWGGQEQVYAERQGNSWFGDLIKRFLFATRAASILFLIALVGIGIAAVRGIFGK